MVLALGCCLAGTVAMAQAPSATNPPAPATLTVPTNSSTLPASLSGYVPDDKYKLRVGDKVAFQILEDRDLPKSLVVADSGELDIPYIGRMSVAGKTCRQLAAEVKAALEKDYYHQATVIIGLILALKGYSVRGNLGLDMPSNWIAAHPGFGEASARAIIGRAEKRSGGFFGRVLAGSRSFNGLISFLAGLVVFPVSAAYLVLGRFFLAKLFFASNRCTGCEHCARNCPVGAIQMRDFPAGRKRPWASWTSCPRTSAAGWWWISTAPPGATPATPPWPPFSAPPPGSMPRFRP